MSDQVNADFNSDDETKIFGKRQIAEISEGVFECVTLASFGVECQDEGSPQISSVSGPNATAIAINSKISILTVTDELSIENIVLDEIVDGIGCTEDGKYVVAALKNGFILVYDITEKSAIFSDNVNVEVNKLKTFCAVCCSKDEENRAFVVTTDGTIIVLTIAENETVDVKAVHTQDVDRVSCAALIVSPFGTPNIVLGGSQVFLYSTDTFENLASFPLIDTKMSIKSLCYCPETDCLLTLFENGCIGMMCPRTLLCFNVLEISGFVQEMSLISSTESSSEKILVLSRLDNSSTIAMIETNGFKDVYSFSVGDDVKLVDHFGNSDDVMFLEKDSRQDIKNQLLLRTIAKSQPEFRLMRLLRQMKFSEAIIFASKYNLDTQQVHKAEAAHYINSAVSEETFGKLKHALAKIEDCHFVTESCLKAAMPSLTETLELLRFAQDRVANLDNSLDLQRRLFCASRRLETFCLLAENQSEWLDFYTGNLLVNLICFLNEGNSVYAGILWRQHEEELLQQITPVNVPDILNVIPTKTDLVSVIAWLEVFVPSVLRNMPETLENIAKILCERVSLRANQQSETWPLEALEFCQKAICAVEPNCLDELSGWLKEWQNQSALPDSPIQELNALHKALSDLMLLRDNLAVRLTLEEYSQLSTIEGIHSLLKKVSNTKLPELFNNFNILIPGSSDIDCEEVISSFIELQVHAGTKLFESLIWEEKIILLIEFLNSQEKTAKCVGRVLQDAPVPWSKKIEEFAVHAESFSDESANVVKKQRHLAGIKELLVKYELLPLLNEGETSLDVNYVLKAIFFHQLPNMLEDAFVISTIRPGSILEVHSLYIEHLLNNFKMGAALEYLRELPPDERELLCERLIVKGECMVKYEMYEEAEEIIAFLAIVETELLNLWKNKMCEAEFKNCSLELSCRIKAINQLLKAFTKFDVSPTKENFQQICNVSESTDCLTTWKQAAEFGNLTELTKMEISMLFAQTNWSSDNMQLLKTILLDGLEGPMGDNEVDLVLNLAQLVPNENLELIEILRQVVGKALLLCPINRINVLLEVANKASEMADLLKHKDYEISLEDFSEGEMMSSKDPFTSWSFTPIFEDKPVNVISSSETLSIIHGMDKILTSEDPDKLERFFTNIELLQVERCDLLAFCITCKYLCTNSRNLSIMKKLSTAKKSMIHSLLNKVLSERKADLKLALELLLTFDLPDAFAWLETAIARVRNDCNHLFRMTQLGIDFSSILQETAHITKLAKFLKFSRWGKKVKKLGLSTRGIMSQHSMTDRGPTLQQIMLTNPNEPFMTMVEFCRDFTLDVNVEIIALIESMILNWEPTLELKKTELGKEQLVIVKNRRFEKRVIQLIRQLNSTYYKGLESRLDTIWDKLNVYHYEMFECLLNLKKVIHPDFTSVQTDVLIFLEPYRRTIAPGEAEIDRWMRIHPDGTVLPILAKIRLPFPSFLKDVHNIIRCEVSLKNYLIWIQAPTVLNLDPDEICISAIKNSIGTEVHLNDMTEWNFQSSEKLVEEVSECVENMRDLAAAAAILDYASKRIPLGQDRISLMDLCHQKLIAAEDEKGPDATSNLELKVSNTLMLYCVVHALHEDNLARREYLKLANKPEELIDALYKDASIMERVCGGVGNYPDIHSAVGKIAHITSLDIEKIRFNILGSLLFSESIGSDSLDESFVDVTKAWQQYNKDSISNTVETNTNLLKARYMLEAGEKQAHMDYIISIINNDNISCSNCVRFRSWRLLLWLAPISAIAEATNIPEADINEHLSILFFLSELEIVQSQAGISVDQFKTTDKKTFIDGIWRNHSSNPRALVLMARVALYYDISSRTVWQNLLTKMIHLKMEGELLELLPKLNSFVNLFPLHPFNRAWNFTILAPFSKADMPMTTEQYDLCKRNLLLLQKCPISSQIDVKNIVDLSLAKQKPELAAVLLPYVPESTSINLAQKILRKISFAELEVSLNQLNKETLGFPILRVLNMMKPKENGHSN